MEIDGSFGEGGGQILRTCLSLSCVTGAPFRACNIRARRKKPGLRPQHLLSVRAAAEVSGAEIAGDDLGSLELTFNPGPLRPADYLFDVGRLTSSAGSTGLVFQTVILPLAFAGSGSRVTIRGGTHVEWSPPADYIKHVFLPLATRFSVRAELENPKKGYYPIGGGEIEARVHPSRPPLSPVEVIDRGGLLNVTVSSCVSNLPLDIAGRQEKRAVERLEAASIHPEAASFTAPSPGRGTYLFILARFESIAAGFSALGARGKRAEDVADEATDKFFSYFNRAGALDPHLSDQVAQCMALAKGRSSFTTTEVTPHLLTNIYVIERFLPVRFSVSGAPGEEGSVSVEGCGYDGSGP
ncbi:MAG: RNA 3'-phosphate cyclase [Deltaproteobacteria bacterium]|nr:RNA 3'-phosphate cyclase [Deltaproteobacteria bacterium]